MRGLSNQLRAQPDAYPRPVGGYRNHSDSACEMMLFENVDDGRHSKDLKIIWLPDEAETIRVSPGIEPEASRDYSLAQEPVETKQGLRALP